MISNQSAMQLPPLIDRWELAYSPQNPYIDALMTETTFIMNLDPAIGRANSLELESYLTTNRIVAGIDFGNELSFATSLPTNLSYAVRYPSELRSGRSNPLIFNWRTDILFPVFQTGGPRNRNETDGGLPSGYSREGFLAIQNSIAAAFLKIQGSQEMPTVFMRVSYILVLSHTNPVKIHFFVAIPLSGTHKRSATARFRSLCIANYPVELCVSLHQYCQVYNNRKRKTAEGGNENHGASELVALDGLVR